MHCVGTFRLRSSAVAALSAFAVFAAAQPARAATLVSETTWGGAVSEVVGDAAVASDGSTYLAGFTTSFATNQTAIFVVKFAPDGTLTWQRTWDAVAAFSNDEARDVAIAPDGSVYVTGSALGVAGDVVLLKLSQNGDLVWQQRWGGAGSESGEAVAVAADGSVYVAGGTNSFGDGGSHFFALKFTPDGTLVWQRIRAGGTAQVVDVAPDGSVAVAGVGARPDLPGAFDAVVLKLDAGGALAWQRAYFAGEVTDARGGVAVSADGSIHVAGAIQDSERKLVVDALLFRLSASGSLLWDRTWGGRSGDVSSGIAIAPDGAVLWSGDTNSFGAGSDDAFVLFVSADGKALDGATWGGAGIEHGDGVGAAPNGTVSLGATAETPPFTFQRAPTKTARARGTVATPETPLADAAGTVVDAGGTLATSDGTTPGAGGFDAALVRVSR